MRIFFQEGKNHSLGYSRPLSSQPSRAHTTPSQAHRENKICYVRVTGQKVPMTLCLVSASLPGNIHERDHAYAPAVVDAGVNVWLHLPTAKPANINIVSACSDPGRFGERGRHPSLRMDGRTTFSSHKLYQVTIYGGPTVRTKTYIFPYIYHIQYIFGPIYYGPK